MRLTISNWLVSKREVLLGLVLLFALIPSQAFDNSRTGRFNVLFIVADDLRPDLGAYGHPIVKSPHIDRLAEVGFRFTRAYSQIAFCNPSRASLLTGLRPETLQIYDLKTNFRDVYPHAITIPQYLKANGYETVRVGKVFHTSHGNRDDPVSWSKVVPPPTGNWLGPANMRILNENRIENQLRGGGLRSKRISPRLLPWEAPEIEKEEDLFDGLLTSAAISVLKEFSDERFFLAVGYSGPHLPFTAPRKYWKMYEPTDIPLPATDALPKGSSTYSTVGSELRNYYGVPQAGPLSDAQARDLIHGYWSAVSYLDAQVGRLMEALTQLELLDKTIVVLLSDHGIHLGEHGFWGKNTNFELDVRIPLIVYVPDQKNPGKKVEAFIELVDVFPTIMDILGLRIPDNLEGTSFRSVLEDPTQPWKDAAFHMAPRRISSSKDDVMLGRAIRTDDFRLIEWKNPLLNSVEYELYDYSNSKLERKNVFHDSAYESVRKWLVRKLEAGWHSALPGSRADSDHTGSYPAALK